MADFEEIGILYEGIKKTVKSQTVQSINKLVASMLSLMPCFAAIAGSIGEKTKMDITRPPLTDILVKYAFVLRRTCPNYWWEKVLPAYCHFKIKVCDILS